MLYERCVTNKINQTEMIYRTLVDQSVLCSSFNPFYIFRSFAEKKCCISDEHGSGTERTSTLIDFKINGESFIQSLETTKKAVILSLERVGC